MHNPLARKLYLRIWLAVAGSVLLLSLVLGWAWHVAERDRELERDSRPPREVVVRNAQGARIGQAQAQWQSAEQERGSGFWVTLDSGEQLGLEFAPRLRPSGAQRTASRRFWVWLRPPYGFLWIVGLAGLAVTLGLYPVARRLTQRLETLQGSVQRWGQGRLDERAPVSGHDEVADLARHFNTSAARMAELLEHQAALLQSQKSLLANASHELRSPLARIRMALALLPEAEAGTATHAEIERNIRELDALIEEILLASRLDAREADLGTVEPVDLAGLLVEECARVGAELELLPGTHDLSVPGVARLLRRAVRNLLENAQRHGRNGPGPQPVQAQLMLQDGHAVLHVDDHGPGVPEGEQERIFEPFYRLPGASEREGGVGLGLALVRSIAERHGGSATCSARPDASTGARFTLSLPLSSS